MKAISGIVLLLWLLGLTTARAADPPAQRAGAASLAELAARADFIALAQVKDTDYLRRRDIPVSGSAYLRVLIPYKVEPRTDLIEVYEIGLHENECYFPNPTVFEEGRRYLVFLRRDPDHPERFRGLAEGCAIDVLVASGNRYAVRWPISGIRLSDPLDGSTSPMLFHDPYAVLEDGTRYTHGIPLSTFSDLMQLETGGRPDEG